MLCFEKENEGRTLLYVEDDPLTRQLTGDALTCAFAPLTIYVARDGKEGVELYRKFRPDLVLTDMNLPVLDGLGMSRQILALDPQAHIVAISAHSEIDYLLEAIKIGVRRYVLKPVDHSLLFEAIRDGFSRVSLERQLRRQEQFIGLLSQVVEQNAHMIAVADREGRLTYVNNRFCEFTGYRADEVLGRHLLQLQPEQPEPSCFEKAWAAAASGSEWRGECANRKKNGESYWESVCVAPLLDSRGAVTHVVSVREDITGRKRQQEELERVQKLESLGVLAGGIAHDFNNILTGILGNISFALRMVEDADELKGPLEDAEQGARRAADLTRQILTFARGGKPVKKEVPVRLLVDEALSLALSGSATRAEVAIPETVHAIEADDGQMLQAFNNILINAVQSMGGEGTLQVRAENVVLPPENELRLAAGSYVRLSFRDEGCGVPDCDQGRIFDPYFTTRPGASGLGLASVHSIVARHRGHISVQSKGRGTTFICHLLSTGAPTEAKAPASAPSEKRQGGTGQILVMDDELMVRKVMARMLESLGYRVTVCATGEEAVAHYRRSSAGGHCYQAVIMDLTVVGGMGGKDAAREILAIDPDAPLVVSSGYYDDPVVADYRDWGFRAVLPKPYRIAELEKVIGGLRS